MILFINQIKDRDGEMFRYVLQFCRDQTLHVPEDFKEWDLLEAEAIYWELYDMKDKIKGL